MTATPDHVRRYRERWHTADTRAVLGVRKQDARIVIPENVRRETYHEPCLRCGAARECAHRPGAWMWGHHG